MSTIARIEEWLTRHSLAAALSAGAVARIVSSIVGLGFHARDDYFHVLAPALAWRHDASFDWAASDLPGAGLRSELVPRLVEGLLAVFARLGITEPESTLRGLHLMCGAYSLLGIWAMWLLAHRLVSPRAARIATWLAALHFAMPYLGTRLLIEAMAMPLVLFGLWLATFSTTRRVVLGGVYLGLACWLRYQVAVVAVGVALVFLIEKRFRAVFALAAGGALALALQGAFDWVAVGKPFAPLIANIAYNAAPPDGLTRSSPLAYLGLWLALTVPPTTLILVPAMVRAARPLRLLWVPFILFVLAHMVVPHKEERFMAPVLPIFLLLMAAAPDAVEHARGRFFTVMKRFAPALAVWLVAVHVLVLVLAITHQSQAGQREALAALRRDTKARALIAMGPEVPEFYLGDRDLPFARNGTVDAVWLRRAMRDLAENGTVANRFMAFAADGFKVTLLLEAMELDCDRHDVFEGSALDRLAYRVNPEHNRRRAPIVVWSCERPDVAVR